MSFSPLAAVACCLVSIVLGLSALNADAEALPDAQPSRLMAVDGRMARDVLFTDAWKFSKGDEPGASNPVFDDSAWRTLDLPHDWSVEAPFDRNLASCTAFLPCGIAWYRKSFTVPETAKEKSIT